MNGIFSNALLLVYCVVYAYVVWWTIEHVATRIQIVRDAL